MRWCTAKIREQLDEGTAPADVKVIMTLTTIRDPSVKWIIDSWRHMQTFSSAVVEGYRQAGTLEVRDKCRRIYNFDK